MGWIWANAESGSFDYARVMNYWLAGGGSARANVVFTNIARSNPGRSSFTSAYSFLGKISYVTADGTSVEAFEPERRSATVVDVASAISAIASGGMGSSAEKAYAYVILDVM